MAGIPPIKPQWAHSLTSALPQGPYDAPSARRKDAHASGPSAASHAGQQMTAVRRGNAEHLPGTMDSARARALSSAEPAANSRRPTTQLRGAWTESSVPVTLNRIDQTLEGDRAQYFHLGLDLDDAHSVEKHAYSELMTAAALEERKTVVPDALQRRLGRQTYSPEKGEIMKSADAARVRKVYVAETDEWVSRTALNERKSASKRKSNRGQADD